MNLSDLPQVFGDTYSLVERCWEGSKKKKKNKKDKDGFKYEVMSDSIRRLRRYGLVVETADLLLVGYPVDKALAIPAPGKAKVGPVKEEIKLDSKVATGCLIECWKAETDDTSKMVELTEDGKVSLQAEFATGLTESKSAGELGNYWRKIFLNCPELLIQYLANATAN